MKAYLNSFGTWMLINRWLGKSGICHTESEHLILIIVENTGRLISVAVMILVSFHGVEVVPAHTGNTIVNGPIIGSSIFTMFVGDFQIFDSITILEINLTSWPNVSFVAGVLLAQVLCKFQYSIIIYIHHRSFVEQNLSLNLTWISEISCDGKILNSIVRLILVHWNMVKFKSASFNQEVALWDL